MRDGGLTELRLGLAQLFGNGHRYLMGKANKLALIADDGNDVAVLSLFVWSQLLHRQTNKACGLLSAPGEQLHRQKIVLFDSAVDSRDV